MPSFKIFAKSNGGPYRRPEKVMNKVAERAAKVQRNLKDLGDPLYSVSTYLDRWVQSNFKTEGGKVGGWVPFSYGGRLTKGGVDFTAKLLQDTGRLRASFTPFHSKTDAGIFSDLDYSKNHEEGIGVPQRRLLPKKIEVMVDIRNILEGAVVKAIRVKK